MKPKFLIDECISKRLCVGDSDFIKSVDILGEGASDRKVFDVVKDTNTILVSDDKRFLFNALANNRTVWYHKEGILIKPVIQKDTKYSDVLTFYLQKTNEIVIP